MLSVGVDRRVSGTSGLFVLGIGVSRALVLPRSLIKVLVLEKKIGHPLIDSRSFHVFGKRCEIRAVPAERFLEVRCLLFRNLRLLIERVIVGGQVFEVSLQVVQDFR